MGRTALPPRVLKLYLVLNATALIGAAVLMLLIAPGAAPSFARIILICAVFVLALIAAGAAILLHRSPQIARRISNSAVARRPGIQTAPFLIFVLLWCLIWLPPQYTGQAYYYFLGLYPLFLWGLLSSGSTLILLTIPHRPPPSEWWKTWARQNRTAIRATLIALGALALVGLFIARLQILRGYEPYWYGAGMPILAGQVMLAVLTALLMLKLEPWLVVRQIPADVMVFLLVWVAAAILWAVRPAPPSFWITPPRPPNFESYPFSDAATYDLGSQFALIGQGIFNRAFFDRALYTSFLVYLHTVGGQNYQQLMTIQAAIFAVLPALLYLVGRQLHGRTAGLVLAALVVMRGFSSVGASAWIDTATFKHMLTDFPTAIGVALFLVLLLLWLEDPSQRVSHLLWAGGVLGLTSLLRPHVLLLLAATALLAAWTYRSRWKAAVGMPALTTLAFLIGVLPWMTFAPGGGSLFAQYGARLRTVMEQRYPRPSPSPAPISVPTPIPPSPLAISPTAVLGPAGSQEMPPTLPAEVPLAPEAGFAPFPDPGPPFVVDHFLHNLVVAGLIFPDSPQLLDARDVVKEGESFWRPRWEGGMSTRAVIMLAISILVLAFGLGVAVQRIGGRGVAPVAVLLLYFAANAIARTSGGRYIVPVDWVLLIYFAVGIADLAHAANSWFHGAPSPPRPDTPAALPKTSPGRMRLRPALPFGLLFLIGSLVPLAGVLHRATYPVSSNSALTDRLLQVLPPGASAPQIATFLQQPEAEILMGRALYPLYYRRGDGEPIDYPAYTARDYPRTVFNLIGRHGNLQVLLPGERPVSFPNASDVIVLGCRFRVEGLELLSAQAVALPDEGVALTRSPAAPLQCPLPNPVCDENGNCF